ncbi:rRNA N6-adenosine-methyltransferase METTL5-like [Saccostrea echinata]|uniref:rRNA N6-adenosine-methyltransferase METTL5-like n=1 Tax=Saccostrea echinata TaxID=191078 RepID=UPI002A8415D4|nr:rRNA N6-adenosine-methyltransferase METTL5-like [Saccostrea echinata]
MKLQKLQSHLEGIDEFDNPKILLEQYPTSPHIAAVMLHEIQLKFGDIAGCSVLDLGCGCGILTIGSVIQEAAYVLGIDVDKEALEVCQRNLNEYEISNVDLLQQDIVNILPKDLKDSKKILSKKFDTVIMNPPFGTKKNAGIDMDFVRAGLMMSTNAVYSLHKSTTREHLCKKAQDWGVSIDFLGQFEFNIAKTFKCHKKKEADIEVDFVRFGHKNK